MVDFSAAAWWLGLALWWVENRDFERQKINPFFCLRYVHLLDNFRLCAGPVAYAVSAILVFSAVCWSLACVLGAAT